MKVRTGRVASSLGGAEVYALADAIPSAREAALLAVVAVAPATRADETPTCPPHLWVVDRWGAGRCRKCGEGRQFTRMEPVFSLGKRKKT